MHSSKDPLHGVTLEALLNALVARYGWAEMARQVNINCFKSDPSIKSSLKFLRRTPWARKEVEAMYLASLDDDAPVEKSGSLGKLAEKITLTTGHHHAELEQ